MNQSIDTIECITTLNSYTDRPRRKYMTLLVAFTLYSASSGILSSMTVCTSSTDSVTNQTCFLLVVLFAIGSLPLFASFVFVVIVKTFPFLFEIFKIDKTM